MSWSEWITGTVAVDYNFSSFVSLADLSGGGSGFMVIDHDLAWGNTLADHTPIGPETVDPLNSFPYGFVDNWWLFDSEGTTSGKIQQNGLQLTAEPNYATFRSGWPSPLNALVEGVDFAPIPGTDYEYVQYQDLPSVLDGWNLPDITNVAYYNSAADTAEWATHVGSIGIPFPVTGMGTVFAEFTVAAAPTSIVIPDPGPVERFYITCRMGTKDAGITPGLGEGKVQGQWNHLYPAVVRVILPPWRYWIPGDPFLWNAQRTDALGGRSAGRGRGATSTQASLRNRGGIH